MNISDNRYVGTDKAIDFPSRDSLRQTSPITSILDIAANGLPIGNDARLVAKVEDTNHGEGKPRPAAVIGVEFRF